MKRIYVDTGGFMGLLVAEDAARALFQQVSAERWQLVTTNIAVIETYSVLLVRTRDRRRSTMMFLDGAQRRLPHRAYSPRR